MEPQNQSNMSTDIKKRHIGRGTGESPVSESTYSCQLILTEGTKTHPGERTASSTKGAWKEEYPYAKDSNLALLFYLDQSGSKT